MPKIHHWELFDSLITDNFPRHHWHQPHIQLITSLLVSCDTHTQALRLARICWQFCDYHALRGSSPEWVKSCQTSSLHVNPQSVHRSWWTIPDHKEELRSSDELLTELQGSVKSEPCEERKITSSNKETCANSFSNVSQRASLYTQRTIPTKWEEMEGHSRSFIRWGHSETAVSKMVTKMLRHCDQEERQTDGSRHWDNIKPTLLRAFAREGAQDFDDDCWLSIAKTAMDLFVIYELFKDTLVVFQQVQNWWITRLLLAIGRNTSSTEEFPGIFNPFCGVVEFREAKRMTGSDSQSFVQPWIPPEKTQKKNLVMLITMFLKHCSLRHIGNAIKMRYFTQDCQKRRIKDCDSGRQSRLQSSPTQQCQDIALSSDFSERRSSIFRTTPNTRAATQGHVGEFLANTAAATAAAAAAETRGWHSEPLETACYLGTPNRNARRYETRHRKGEQPGNWYYPLLKRLMILISLWKKNSLIRILKPLKESNLVRTKFVFKKTLQRRR